jgi:hypothetical protein
VLVAATAQDGEQLKSVADITATDGLPDTDEAVFIVDDDSSWPSFPEIVPVPVAPDKLWLAWASLVFLLGLYRLYGGLRRT